MFPKIKKITQFIQHKLIVGLGAIRTYKNWPICFLDYLGLLKNRELIYHLRNGVKYKIKGGSGAFQIINETWILNHYSPNPKFAIKDNFIVIDVGANIGSFSIFAGKSAQKIEVFSYEPVKENFGLLLENIKINNLQNVKPFNLALSNQRGKKKIYINKSDSGAYSFLAAHSFFNFNKKYYLEVGCITLKDVFELNKIGKCNFLKIDVEGAEYEILFNTPKEIFRKIHLICLEFHDALTAPKYTHQDLMSFLTDLNFEVKKHNKFNLLYAINKEFKNENSSNK